MRRWDCMHHDLSWVIAMSLACGLVVVGYLLIGRQWDKHARLLGQSPAAKSLSDLKWVFVLCGFCGYTFPIVAVFWPCWRLEVIVLCILNFFTWSFVFNQNRIKFIYTELAKVDMLEKEVRIKDQFLLEAQLKLATLAKDSN